MLFVVCILCVCYLLIDILYLFLISNETRDSMSNNNNDPSSSVCNSLLWLLRTFWFKPPLTKLGVFKYYQNFTRFVFPPTRPVFVMWSYYSLIFLSTLIKKHGYLTGATASGISSEVPVFGLVQSLWLWRGSRELLFIIYWSV